MAALVSTGLLAPSPHLLRQPASLLPLPSSKKHNKAPSGYGSRAAAGSFPFRHHVQGGGYSERPAAAGSGGQGSTAATAGGCGRVRCAVALGSSLSPPAGTQQESQQPDKEELEPLVVVCLDVAMCLGFAAAGSALLWNALADPAFDAVRDKLCSRVVFSFAILQCCSVHYGRAARGLGARARAAWVASSAETRRVLDGVLVVIGALLVAGLVWALATLRR